MSSAPGKDREKRQSLRCVLAAAVFPLLFAASAHGEDLNTFIAQRVAGLTGKTILFRNDSDRIPQVEYLRTDGTGAVWSAALGDKVVPVLWSASNGEDGKGAVCLMFKGADIGTPQDISMCDALDAIDAGIRDRRDGDPYGLLQAARMKSGLPQDIDNLADVDKLLGME